MTHSDTCADERVAAVVAAYQGLCAETLPALLALYSEQAQFKDPFNEVCGRPAIEHIFRHMFDTLDAPRFVVATQVCQGDDAFLTWEFSFRRGAGGALLSIRGASHLHFSAAGGVDLHRDYWDPAEELYSKLPLLGAVMRGLRHLLSAQSKPWRKRQQITANQGNHHEN